MGKIADKKRRILRGIFGGLSLTAVAFVFEACYGMPEDFGLDTRIEGVVKSKTTNEPIEGIKVSIEHEVDYYTLTDSNGQFVLFVPMEDRYEVKFEDVDSIQNGIFLPKDTTLIRDAYGELTLNVSLEDAQ
ncbi:hypothetical protein AGMMS49982_08090 [Bacteroidia bacterium]|nr:hypothetical protein AGMMS49982_08090 [Bacteroidia bacterium]